MKEGNIELSGGEEHGNNAQMSGDNAAQNAGRDTPVDSNASEHSIYEQGQDQDENQDEAVREELKRFLNESDDGLRVPSGEDEEEWRERRKRFNEEIAHQIASRWHDEGYDIAYEDLFAYAAVEQSEQGDPVMFDYGSEQDESDEDIEDGGNDDTVDDVEINASDAPEQVRTTITPGKGVAMTLFDDIMHNRVDVEPLNLSARTTCPKCGGEKLEAEQKIGVSKRYCCQNGAVLDVDDQRMPFRKLERSSRDPNIVTENELRDLLRNEENTSPHTSPQRRKQHEFEKEEKIYQFVKKYDSFLLSS